jgi:hypothetical protein
MFARLIFLVSILAGSVVADEWDAKHLGFSGIPIQGNDTLMKGLGFAKLPVKKGILVAVVNPDTPTAARGLLPLAIVSAINRKPVGSIDDASAVLEGLEIGDDVLLAGHTLRNNVWKSGTVKTKVMTHRDVLESTMERTVDSINGFIRYDHKFDPEGQLKRVKLYALAQTGRAPQLRAETLWVDKEWLFLQSLTLANGADRETADVKPFTGQEKIKTGYIVEQKTCEVSPAFGALLIRPDTTVRFTGTKTYYDHDPTILEIWINKDVLDFYCMMSAKP